MSIQETFDISYYHCCHHYCTYCTSFNVDIKKISHNLEKKLIKLIQKKIGQTIYFYKSVNIIIFLLYLEFYQSFKNYHAGKLNKTDLVNECFPRP